MTDHDVLIQIRDLIAAHLGTAVAGPKTISVEPGELTAALEDALEIAETEDVTLVLAPGDYVGQWTLPARTGTGRITLTADPATLPNVGTRITPAYEGQLPRLVSGDGTTPLHILGSGYTLRGIQVMAPAVGYTHIEIGSGSETDSAHLPSDIRLEQILIRGDAVNGGHRGIAMNGIDVAVVDSWIDRMWELGRDSQAVCAWNTPGPLEVRNNYLEASGENILLGGAVSLTGTTPSDVIIDGNTVVKDPEWRNLPTQPQVKNLLEIKFGKRVSITRNAFRFNWQHAQSGWSILFTTKSQIGTPQPWAVIEDVTFEGNIIRDISSGVNIANDEGPVRNITIRHNVFDHLDRIVYGGDGRWLLLQPNTALGFEGIDISHNTVLGVSGTAWGTIYGSQQIVGLTMTHNVTDETKYGLHTSQGMGTPGLEAMAPGYVFTDNALVDDQRSIQWPAGTVMLPVGTDLYQSYGPDYSLISGSPVAGVVASDGGFVGADFTLLP